MSTSDDLRLLRLDFEAGRLAALEYREQRMQVLADGPAPINHLVVLHGGARQTHEVRQSEFQIGADPNAPDNDLIVGLEQVSNRHALFRFQPDAAWVKDLGSTNGTFVNGQELGKGTKMQIRPGDQVGLSKEFVLVYEGDRDESSSEGPVRNETAPAADSVALTRARGGFRLLGGAVLEPGEYVVCCQHIEPPEFFRAAAYVAGAAMLLTIVLSPIAIWAWRKHTHGPGYLSRYYLTNRRAIEAHQRSYRNIWFEDLIDVFVGPKGNLVAKDRPRFGLPGTVKTVHADSRSIVFEALPRATKDQFETLLKEAKELRGPLEGKAQDLGPY